MSAKSPIVAFLPANNDACALFRMFIPHINLPKSKYVYKQGGLSIEDFCEADVAVVQRQTSQGNYAAIQIMHQVGMKVVYDLDDNIWAVPAYNPAYRSFKEMQRGFGECANQCDAVTVSTRGLATAVKTALPQLKPPVFIVPNAMDFRFFHLPPVTKDDGKVIIGWGGSNTHDHDVDVIWPVLRDVLDAHENVYVELVGGITKPPLISEHPRVIVKPWVPLWEYGQRFSTWAWDILLAPIADNRFNLSKSCLKLLEAAAIGAAVLASDVGQYHEFCTLGGPELVSSALCLTGLNWKTKLIRLVQSVDARSENARLARTVAQQFFNASSIARNWEYVFKQLCPR